jgi:hypothetical protein
MLVLAMPPAAKNFIFTPKAAPADNGNMVLERNFLRAAKSNVIFKRSLAPADVYFPVKIVVSLRRILVANVSLPHSSGRAVLY